MWRCSPDPPEIPDKLYFKIGEVSDLLGVEPYVLRYWETEFPGAVAEEVGHRAPAISAQRRRTAAAHQALLYEKRFTIEGARQTLAIRRPRREAAASKKVQQELFADDPLPDIRRELADILDMLK